MTSQSLLAESRYRGPGIPTPDDPEFRELQRHWYGLAGYSVERDEYAATPQQFGGKLTCRLIEETDVPEDPDDEDLSDYIPDLSYDEDFSYDLAAEVEAFVRDVAIIAGLTAREYQVVEWIAQGNSVVGDYAQRMADAIGISPDTARKHKENAVAKLREHWAVDMDAQGLVDPRYLEPVRADEYVCDQCHLIRHVSQKSDRGLCIECEELHE